MNKKWRIYGIKYNYAIIKCNNAIIMWNEWYKVIRWYIKELIIVVMAIER
jgi:hypothetical protein